MTAPAAPGRPLRHVPAGTREYPLSYLQESLWPPEGRSAISVPAVVRLGGPLDLTRLRAALAAVTERHDALRTTVGRDPDGCLRQRVAPAGELGLTVTRRASPAGDALAGTLLAGAERPFRVDGGPLARAELHSDGDSEHLLLVWLHHMVSDLVSSQILADEIRQAYAGAALPAPGCQPGEHALSERAATASPRQQRYWATVLAGAGSRPGLPALPPARHRAVRPALPWLPWDAVTALGALATSHRTTLTAVLAAAVAAAHAAEGDGERIVLGLTVSNRDQPRLRSTVGCLADQLPLVVDVSGDPPFTALLARVRGALLDAYEHRLPLGVLLPWLGRARPPVFAVNLNFLPPPPGAPGPQASGEVELPFGITKRLPDPWWLGDALLAYRPRICRRGLGGEVEGDLGVCGPGDVAARGERLHRVLGRAAQAPGTPLSALTAG